MEIRAVLGGEIRAWTRLREGHDEGQPGHADRISLSDRAEAGCTQAPGVLCGIAGKPNWGQVESRMDRTVGVLAIVTGGVVEV